jgi:hypothetical protein
MRFLAGALALVMAVCWWLPAQTQKKSPKTPPLTAKKIAPPPDPAPASALTVASAFDERLTYSVEWRLIHAGEVIMEKHKGRRTLRMESAGIVSTLFKVEDVYTVDLDEPFCVTSSLLESMEGKKHHETRVTYDRVRNHAFFVDRDLVNNTVLRETGTDIPNCVSDVTVGFARLRSMNVPPGQSTQIPVSDGRRFANVKIQAQQREEIKTVAGTYQTIRYDADLMNGNVYTRKGQVLLWISDDARRLPVQIELKTTFPVSTVTLQLEKEEHP